MIHFGKGDKYAGSDSCRCIYTVEIETPHPFIQNSLPIRLSAICSREHLWLDGSNSAAKGLGWCAEGREGLWELEGASLGELEHLISSQFSNLSGGRGSDDLDRLFSGTVATGHLEVHLRNGTAERGVSVLLEHVDGSSSGQISQVNAIVLHSVGSLLEDLAGGDDFTLDSSDLVLTLHVVPEVRASDNWVTTENAHSVKSWVWLSLGWESTANNVVLSNLHKNESVFRRKIAEFYALTFF